MLFSTSFFLSIYPFLLLVFSIICEMTCAHWWDFKEPQITLSLVNIYLLSFSMCCFLCHLLNAFLSFYFVSVIIFFRQCSSSPFFLLMLFKSHILYSTPSVNAFHHYQANTLLHQVRLLLQKSPLSYSPYDAIIVPSVLTRATTRKQASTSTVPTTSPEPWARMKPSRWTVCSQA